MRQMAQEEIQMLQNEKRQLASQIMSQLSQKDCNEEVHPDQSHSTHQSKTSSARMEIRAGAGGDEAALFIYDLFAMFEKFALRKKLKSKILSQSSTSLGGLRELILRVSGPLVYETMRLEAAVHRVQRAPDTETSGRVHTSTASVAVLRGDLHLAKRFCLRESDVKFDVCRASGADGQHVNKTESALRATHIPTGLVATSQEDRSQNRNQAIAIEAVAARLAAKLAAKQASKRVSERRAQMGRTIGERSDRIPTYNYQQRRATDHRIIPSTGLLDFCLFCKGNYWRQERVSRARELEPLYVLIEGARKMRSTTSDELGDKFAAGMEAV
ncbi:Peptide chain release factor RF1 [Gracilaria domingensis]|nr:Peptide chain release factor RF1 [Gracilaria domingensis]